MQPRPIQRQITVAVVTHINVLIVWITAIVPCKPPTIFNVGSPAALDGHSPMANASPVGVDAILNAELVINRQLMLVAPIPQNWPMNQFRQLPGRNLIPIAKTGMRAVMRQQNQSALVAVGIHR